MKRRNFLFNAIIGFTSISMVFSTVLLLDSIEGFDFFVSKGFQNLFKKIKGLSLNNLSVGFKKQFSVANEILYCKGFKTNNEVYSLGNNALAVLFVNDTSFLNNKKALLILTKDNYTILNEYLLNELVLFSDNFIYQISETDLSNELIDFLKPVSVKSNTVLENTSFQFTNATGGTITISATAKRSFTKIS